MEEGTLYYWTWCLYLQFIPFRFIMQKYQSVMWSFPSLHGKWHTLFYHSSNPSSSPHIFYSKHGEQMAYLDTLVWLQSRCDMPVRKNYINTDITEPVRIIRILAIHSYRNANVKLKREKKKNQHLAHHWHLTQYIKIILEWGISPTLSRYVCVNKLGGTL